MVMASGVLVLFGDKIRSQTKPFLYLFQLVAAKDPVHEYAVRPSWLIEHRFDAVHDLRLAWIL